MRDAATEYDSGSCRRLKYVKRWQPGATFHLRIHLQRRLIALTRSVVTVCPEGSSTAFESTSGIKWNEHRQVLVIRVWCELSADLIQMYAGEQRIRTAHVYAGEQRHFNVSERCPREVSQGSMRGDGAWVTV